MVRASEREREREREREKDRNAQNVQGRNSEAPVCLDHIFEKKMCSVFHIPAVVFQ